MLFPVVRKAPRDACGPVCVNVNVSLSDFSFVAFSARSHTDQTCWPVPSVRLVLVLSLSEYWPSPLHFSFWPPLPIVRVLQEPV